ncbi:MAG: hypothetical protein K5798_05630 [Nitrosopumilus sp.]|uniref:Uncharacterized protein n=2 Tax=Nitrosopumilaceae TaxID=338190 RepID=A0A2S2KTD6_9ARCH|nr:hypothetical protein [Nitrosopumilus sp.]GBH34725.1 hypothetical protein NZNM25_15160 [Nitrosopumilus zosterae]
MPVSRKIMICSILIMLSVIIILKTGSSEALNTSNDFDEYRISQMPETRFFDQYDELSAPEKTAVVYPILTQTAYAWGGIHDFYLGRCDTCSEIKIEEYYDPIFSVGAKSFRILEFLGYSVIDDIDIDKNPEILDNFNSIVLLHNEFVTENEFLAITSHPNVIFMYPGALNSKVKINYDKETMILQRGPSFPDPDTVNGFDWKYDNSNISNNTICEEWEFYKIENGHMLNCTPEDIIQNNDKILKELKRLAEF